MPGPSITIPEKILPALDHIPKDEILKKINIPLNGKLVLSDHPTEIGTNFQILKNMEYADTHPKGVLGMTKINTTGIAVGKVLDSAFHFTKPKISGVGVESHLLAHIYDVGGATSYLLQNTQIIPHAGNFLVPSLITDTLYVRGIFMSPAPGGNVVYCNGQENYIWGGDEINISAFITSSAAITTLPTNPIDLTARMLNTLSDSLNIINIGGGIDAYTKLMLHGDGIDGSTTITDSEITPKAVTAVGNAQIDTAQKRFGTGSILFDGTGDYLTTPDHADWYFADQPFTIDTWVRFNVLTGNQGIAGQYVDSDNLWYLEFYGSAIYFYVKSGGVAKANYAFPFSPVVNTQYHIALSRSGANVYCFANGTSLTPNIVTAISTNEVPNLAAVLEVGAALNHAQLFNGWLDEFRVSKGIARWTANFNVPTTAYTQSPQNWLVGSPRPLQGLKYYVSRANSVAGVMTGGEWSGAVFTPLTLTDNTSVAGATLAQTGTVTFNSTVNSSKPILLAGLYLYWYNFSITSGDADIYFTTLDAPMQPIVDLWDGVFKNAIGCYYNDNGTYIDNVNNVYADDYNSGDPTSYLAIPTGGMAYAQDSILVGFSERQSALYISIPSDGNKNIVASIMSVSYNSGGLNWNLISGAIDTTSVGGATLNKTGMLSWTSPDAQLETTTNFNNIDNAPMYWYKLTFSADLTATTRIDSIFGVPAQRTIKKYKFSFTGLDSLFLCNEVNGRKNQLILSVQGSPQVFNGNSVYEIDFGDSQELTGGCVVYSQFGSSIYNLILIFKVNEVWALVKNSDSSWTRYIIDNGIGLVAPKTLDTVTLPLETATGINRNLAIWQGVSGVYVSDGRSPISIHKDIESLFDQSAAVHIHPSYIDLSTGKVDRVKMQYRWCFASNSSTDGTLDKEYLFDLRRWKWFEVDRTTGKRLQDIVTVKDSMGNYYLYGVITGGYLERLNYGQTFDGVDITCQMKFGELTHEKDTMQETQVNAIVLTQVAKANTVNNVALVHTVDGFPDGAFYGVAYAFDPTPTTANKSYVTRYTEPASEETPGVFHSYDLSMVANNETIGFEPLHLGIYYKESRNITVSKV